MTETGKTRASWFLNLSRVRRLGRKIMSSAGDGRAFHRHDLGEIFAQTASSCRLLENEPGETPRVLQANREISGSSGHLSGSLDPQREKWPCSWEIAMKLPDPHKTRRGPPVVFEAGRPVGREDYPGQQRSGIRNLAITLRLNRVASFARTFLELLGRGI
jgi:hypothetical protein